MVAREFTILSQPHLHQSSRRRYSSRFKILGCNGIPPLPYPLDRSAHFRNISKVDSKQREIPIKERNIAMYNSQF